MSEEAWWKRLDGLPAWVVKQRSRVYGPREVVFYRMYLAVHPLLCLGGAWALRSWFLVIWSVYPLVLLFVSLPRHQRQQILGRPAD